MRLLIKTLVCLILIPIQLYSQSGCQHKANVAITSLNFTTGCPFGDSGGLDPVLEILNPDGSQFFIMHLSDLAQINGPAQNVVTDFSDDGNPNTCPSSNFSNKFCLGPLPVSQGSVNFRVRIYEKSSNFLNGTCNGYNFIFDSELGEADFTFDFNQSSGTIDVGSCISFNYDLTLEFTGFFEEDIVGPICPEFNLLLDGTIYDINNPTGQFIKPGDNTCDTIVNVDLTFFSVPDVQLSGDFEFCPSSLHTIGVDNAIDYETFLWSTGDITSSIVVSEPGDYSVIASTINACTKEVTFTIDTFIVNPVNIIGEDLICENSLIDLAVTGNPTQIMWEDGSTDPLLVISQPGLYTVTTTDANGCTSSAAKEVLLSPSPSITFIGDEEICQGETTTLSTFENHTTYIWTDFSENETLSVSAAGTYGVTVTNNEGCSANASITVTAFDLPQPELEGVQDFCFGENITLSTTIDFEEYLWDDSSSDSELIVFDSGIYTLQVTDLNGCTNTTAAMVIESAELTPVISGDLSFCQGDIGVLTLDQIYPSIMWQDGSNTQSLDVTSTGTYVVTVSDVNGCTSETQADVTVLDQLQPQLTGGNSFCEGQTLTLGLSNQYASQQWSDNSAGSELTVTTAGNFSVTVTDNNGCTGSAQIDISEIPAIQSQVNLMSCDTAEVGTVILQLTSASGCDSLVTQTTSFDSECLIMFDSVITDASCATASDGSISISFTQGESPFMVLIVSNGDTLQSFNLNDAASTISFDGLIPDEYLVLFPTQTDANFTFTVEVDEQVLDLPEQVVILEGSSTTLQANISGLAATSFEWLEGTEPLCASNCSEVEVMPASTTTYTFRAESDEGCIWQDTTVVIVNAVQAIPQNYVPNIFNPNMSGDNGSFRIFSSNEDLRYNLEIYDRWGNQVFTGDQSVSWSGIYRGRRAEAGVYVYKLTLMDIDQLNSQVLSGSFLLIR